MTMDEVKEASVLVQTMTRFDQYARNIRLLCVSGISLNHPSDGPEVDGVILRRHATGGGTITSLGLPDGLSEVLTQVMLSWLEAQADEARARLRVLGVTT